MKGKRKMRVIWSIILATVSMGHMAHGQESRLKYADKLYEQLSYYEASEGYEDVIARKVDSSLVADRLADCYDKIGNVEKAVEWYTYTGQNKPLTAPQHMRLALLQRQLGNYDESINLMASYEQRFGENDVSQEVRSYGDVTPLTEMNECFEVHAEGVNTASSEIGTSFAGDSEVLISNSSRVQMAVNRIHSWTGNYFYDIYRAPISEDGTIGKMKRIKGDVETKFHDGPAVYDSASGYLYFTRNNFLDGKSGTDSINVVRLKIYRAKLDGERFSNVEELSINSNDFSNAHPAVSKDGKRMYFASDRPGGYGGMDIYSVEIHEDGTLGTPVNMGGMVNTSQNDVFPSYNSNESLLFFASEGHAGLGGLDVYVARLKKSGEARSIENLGAPVNSRRDDFSFVNNEGQTMGYFSSNRPGGKGSDDVYRVKQLIPIGNSPVIRGNVTDLLTSENLDSTTVYLVSTDGTVMDSTITDLSGNFELELGDIESEFQLVANRDGYIQGVKDVEYSLEKEEYEEDLSLMPVLKYHFEGLVSDAKTNDPLQNVKVAIVDNTSNESFSTPVTDDQGDFVTEELPYGYQDSIDYAFTFEKEGYITKTVSLEEILAMEETINVEERLNLKLTRDDEENINLGDIIALNPIYFDLDKYYIRPDAARELDKIVDIMNQNPRMIIELQAHTDSRASDEYNMVLSDRRAKASAKYIISQGIAANRISGKGFGETQLKISDEEIEKAETEKEKEALHQINRRTDPIVIRAK